MSGWGTGASGALRRSPALLLMLFAALLLLLLAARAPPAPPAPLRPRPLPLAVAPPAVPVNVTHRAPANGTVKPATRPADRVTRAPGAPLVSDIYEAGHERPHPELCPALGAHVKVLIMVTSAPGHARARDAIRLTWGHFAARRDVAFAFALGRPPSALRPALDAEDALYGDLVVGRSVDSYSNLTLKTLSILEWADTYCPRAPRLLKTDDDMFINVPRLLRFAAARVNATNTIWGKVVKKSLPKRTSKSKYFVPVEQFAGAVFPEFATGPAYLLTADAVRTLRAAAARRPYLRLEDVFVTGVVASAASVRRVHAPEFLNRKAPAHPCALQRALSLHMVQFHEQFDLWRKLLDGKTKCAG
ncbi:beta-1,3-galactosyltransferase 5-like [Pieris brassicae]|uniref:beta-1,3-galactosyltransferase 5-like n=1 Tax=Pieris brassicae TaxID=7116 RepID=UPI001E65E90A|nr:beta-1,3-galactosyltransferase 5-like [Pieris brassicae]